MCIGLLVPWAVGFDHGSDVVGGDKLVNLDG